MDDAAKRATGQLSDYGYASRDRSAGEIVKDIVNNAQEIIRSEVRLAKAEIREESRKAIQAGIALGAGVVLGLFGLGFLLAAITAVLALAMPWWGAALIVGGLLAIAGGVGMAVGIERWKKVHPTPEKTIADVKENVEWLKRQTKF
jgi:uncharacterized membrane protein YqjE